MTENQEDIATEEYKGPGRVVSAGALAAIEGKVGGIVGFFGGAAAGAWQHKIIDEYLQKRPGLNAVVEGSVGMLGNQYRNSPTAKAATAGALVVGTVLPFIGMMHGTWKGYQVADGGLHQFQTAQKEILQLRKQLDQPHADRLSGNRESDSMGNSHTK